MMDQNIFVTKLLDVQISNKSKDLSQAEGVFIVMEYVAHDIRSMLDKIKSDCLSEEHVKIIMYNLLCSVHFMHSAGLMHRDIKPCNLLIDGECSIKLCDFGQSRPFFTDEEKTTFDKQDGEKPKRRLSAHISSRWYRPPEVILTHQDYDSKVDIWALGCVFAEILLLISSKNNSKSNVKLSDVILFPGKSCYPFTEGKGKGENSGTATVRSDDQLIKILELLGVQNKKDYSFLVDNSAVDYLKLIQGNIQQKDSIDKRFKACNSEFVDLLKKMLEFNPHTRWTARQCLDHPVFNDIRDP